MTGSARSVPSTRVRRSREAGKSASRGGANRNSPNAPTLSRRVTPASAPASIARKTGSGSRLRARRCASATVSNQCRVLAMTALAFGLPVGGPAAGQGGDELVGVGVEGAKHPLDAGAASEAALAVGQEYEAAEH